MGAFFLLYNRNSRLLLVTLRLIIMGACMLAALHLENPSPERLAVLAVFMSVLLLWVNLRDLVPGRLLGRFGKAAGREKEGGRPEQGRLLMLVFLGDVALLYILEQNSRFILNYYLHLLYFVLMVNAGVSLSRKQGLLVNSAALIVFLSKFARLLSANYSPFNVSLAMFSFFTGILTLIIISYAKSMAEEKEKTDILYSELKTYAGKVRELSITGERNRIAGELHDIIGHSLTALTMELEICSRIMAGDSQKAQEIIKNATTDARNALINVRRAVDALKPGELEGKTLNAALAVLVQKFSRNCGLRVELNFELCPALSPRAELAVFRVVQEALTNSQRHGKATTVKICAAPGAGSTVINISDDGCGTEEIVPGHGLNGMRQRVESVGGRLSYNSRGRHNGFSIEIHLPEVSKGFAGENQADRF